MSEFNCIAYGSRTSSDGKRVETYLSKEEPSSQRNLQSLFVYMTADQARDYAAKLLTAAGAVS
jgi:hypothetical protein